KTELDVAAQFRQQRENYQKQAARLIFSVETHLESLRGDVILLEKEKEISSKTKKEAVNHRDEHSKFKKNYDRRRRLLAIDEAKQVLTKAEEARIREEPWLGALRTAHRRRRMVDCERLITNFVHKKQDLEKAKDPDRKNL